MEQTAISVDYSPMSALEQDMEQDNITNHENRGTRAII